MPNKTISIRRKGKIGYMEMPERKQETSLANRQATITAIDNMKANQLDRPKADTPYRAQRGEHMDRANAFVRVSLPISTCTAIAFVCVAWLGLDVPVFSLATLTILFGGFTVTYFGTWIISNLFTHYGVQLYREMAIHNRLSKNDEFMRQQFKERYRNE